MFWKCPTPDSKAFYGMNNCKTLLLVPHLWPPSHLPNHSSPHAGCDLRLLRLFKNKPIASSPVSSAHSKSHWNREFSALTDKGDSFLQHYKEKNVQEKPAFIKILWVFPRPKQVWLIHYILRTRYVSYFAKIDPDCLVWIQARPVSSTVTLERLLYLSEPPFSICDMGIIPVTVSQVYCKGSMCHFVLAHKCSINVVVVVRSSREITN